MQNKSGYNKAQRNAYHPINIRTITSEEGKKQKTKSKAQQSVYENVGNQKRRNQKRGIQKSTLQENGN